MSSQPIPTPTPVDMFGPDGQVHEVQSGDVQAALGAGGEFAHQLKGPDGQIHYVRHSQLGDALRAGGVPVAATQQKQAPSPTTQQPGFFTRLIQSTPLASLTDPKELLKTALIPGYSDWKATNQQIQDVSDLMQESKEAGANIAQGGPVGANLGKIGYAGLKAGLSQIPLGPNIQTAGEDIAQRNYAGAAGGLTGVIAQITTPYLAERLGAAIDAAKPSTMRSNAGQLFSQVSQTAGKIPVDVSAAGDTALQIRELAQSGGTQPKVIKDFIARATDPSRGPITYDEARLFQQNASRLSADEYNRLTPQLQRLVGQFARQLNDANQGAAGQVGMGQQYGQAMQGYRDAASMSESINRLREMGAEAGKKTVIYGPTAAIGGYGIKKLFDAIAGK